MVRIIFLFRVKNVRAQQMGNTCLCDLESTPPSELHLIKNISKLNYYKDSFDHLEYKENLETSVVGNLQKLSDQLATNEYPAHLDGLLNFGFHGIVFIFSSSDVQCEGVDDF